MKKIDIRKRVLKRGFTLIELMVSLTIFSIVMLISTGTLLTLIDANAKAQALYIATTNLSFALDTMTRDMRTGHYFRCENDNGNHFGTSDTEKAKDCNSGFSLTFTRDWNGDRVEYKLDENQIKRNVNNGGWSSLTSPEIINVSTLEFVVDKTKPATGGGGNDSYQPIINIIVKGSVNNGLETDTDFNMQTRIIPRRLDII